jgi:hypothetical protein
LRTVFGAFFPLGFEDLAIGAASFCRAKQDLSDRYFLAICAFTGTNPATEAAASGLRLTVRAHNLRNGA